MPILTGFVRIGILTHEPPNEAFSSLALFADGSVQFLREGLDIKVAAALVTRNGGEILPPNTY